MTTIKKAQTGKKVAKKPTYKNLKMGVANQSKAEGRDYTEVATKQDSINYKRGFARGLKKDKETRNDIDEVEKQGRWEGLNTKKNGGPVKKVIKKAKNGAKFPDLNKDGKVTRADILKGRGVIAKKGATIKKAQAGKKLKLSEKYSKTADSLSNEDLRKMTAAGKMTVNRKEPRWKQKTDSLVKSADKDFKGSLEARKKSYELRKKGLKTGGSVSKKMKNGGSMKKCKYGCK